MTCRRRAGVSGCKGVFCNDMLKTEAFLRLQGRNTTQNPPFYKKRSVIMELNLQRFADAGTLVNTTTGTVNAYDGTTSATGFSRRLPSLRWRTISAWMSPAARNSVMETP